MEILIQVFTFMVLGLLGGITYVFINSDSINDLTKFESLKHYVISVICGYLYNILYSEHNFPNSIMCFVSGYMGTTFIKGLVDKFNSKEQI